MLRKLVPRTRSIRPALEISRGYFQGGGNDAIKIPETERYISREEVERFMVDCMASVKTPRDRASRLAKNLTEADVRGHFSHGLNRLAMYVSDIEANLCNPTADPVILKEGVSTAWVDGQNTLGVVVGEFCMKVAIKKAKENGIGWVAAKGSNHFGICQWYTSMATEENMIGIASTNTSPLVAPTRGKEVVFGTNPFSVAAKSKDGDGYILDMSTSAVAVGKIEMQLRKRQDLPTLGWALGKEGKPTRDAREAFYEGKGLMPLGGEEINSGYKGYGLGMMVDLFCGLMSGSHYGANIRHWTDYTDQVADLGHFFVAIDPEAFAPGFGDRLQDLIDHLRNMEPTDKSLPVLVPGDPEKNALKEVEKAGAILYTEDHITTYRKLAERLKVEPMKAFVRGY